MQRVFDAKCEKDKIDLFHIIRDDAMRIDRAYSVYDSTGMQLGDLNHIKINWGDLTEITRPEKNESIGKEPDFISNNLTVLAHGNKFTMWNYKQDTNFENLDFNSVSNIIENGDVVFLNLSNNYNTMAFLIKDKNGKITLREK